MKMNKIIAKNVAKTIGIMMSMTFVVGVCCVIGGVIPSIIGVVFTVIMMETSAALSRGLFVELGFEEIFDEVANIYFGRWYGEFIVVTSELVTCLIIMGISRNLQLYLGWSCIIWPIIMGIIMVISFFRLRKIGII